MTPPTPHVLPWGEVKLLGLDIDGVLTDGGVTWDSTGVVSRRFDIKDGLGLVRFMEAGGLVAVISSSTSEVGRQRLEALGVTEIHTGVANKADTLREVLTRHGVDVAHSAYLGDDLPDLGCFEVVRIACSPADAAQAVIDRADYVTTRPGGRGAVREVCDLIVDGAS